MNEMKDTQVVVFGLTYLEEEEAEVMDIVGCISVGGGMTSTGCDDTDGLPPFEDIIP